MDIQRRRPEPELYQQRQTSFRDSALNVAPKKKSSLGKFLPHIRKIKWKNIFSGLSCKINYRKSGIVLGGVVFLIGGVFLFRFFTTPVTLSTITDELAGAGQEIARDLTSTANTSLIREEKGYLIQDDNQEAIKITYAGKTEEEKKGITIAFPDDISEPVEVRLDDKRVFKMIDESGVDYDIEAFSGSSPTDQLLGQRTSVWKKLFGNAVNAPQDILRYQSRDGRKTLLYAYQKDAATGEKRLRQWTLYENGSGEEKEQYRFEGAKLRLASNGDVEVRYESEQDLKNQAASQDVDPSLMERAQKVIQAEMGADMNAEAPTDAVIPKPFYLDKDGKRTDLEWKIEGDTLKLAFSVDTSLYPIALDPTLQFTASGSNSGGTVIRGESGTSFGNPITTGDLNTDGKTDLIIGSSSKVYIFYNKGGSAPTQANSADITIATGATSLAIGDLNADGKVDLAVGISNTAYIFYNDGSIPVTTGTADVTIAGESGSGFGRSMTTGDLNTDGKMDLVVGGPSYSTTTGRAYIFYNDGSIPTTAATADVIITGGASPDNFSYYGMATGDLNADGTTDLVVVANNYSSATGRAYIFYNDGSIPTSANSADVIITGSGGDFGSSAVTGDLNADGRIDLVIGSQSPGGSGGRAYIFYNDGSIPTTAATADVTITGESSSLFSRSSLVVGDFNADGRTDLAAGAYQYSSSTGRAYIFYNDGSIPTTAATADVIITGEASSNNFGIFLGAGDLNADGKTDLIVGADGYSSSRGSAYIFYSQNGQVNTNFSITGGATGDYFGTNLATGDLNADGKIDLVVGAPFYSSYTGRAYIFYGDSSIPTTAGTADVTITGAATNDMFGSIFAVGDFNSDGETDLAVGAPINGGGVDTGNVYLFYNDGSIPTTAGTADVTIAGTGGDGNFGTSLVAGDFNTNGRVDIAAGGDAGDAYIFYNDGSIPTTAGAADVTFSGSNNYGSYLASGDLNADGTTDLVVSESGYTTNTGRVYIYYNDGSYGAADVTITGAATSDYFGYTLTTGDLNADSRVDLIVSSTGGSKVYIFYNDGSIPTTAGTADITISQGSSLYLTQVATGDLNGDNRTDLVVGDSLNDGVAYIFYNDGSIPTTFATADVAITGDLGATSSFGSSITVGDMNTDGRTDVVISGSTYSSGTGRVYIYETRDNFSWQFTRSATSSQRTEIGTGQEVTVDGVDTAARFGYAMTSGDLNADGKVDLIVGADEYNSTAGRVYIFYNTGNLPATTAGVDTITGDANTAFGASLSTGDFNADGRTDLAVGAPDYSTATGRVYLFYNDGSIPDVVANANVTLTGEATNNFFGLALAGEDLNRDGETDVIASAPGYSTNTGRTYIYHNDGSYGSADVTITGNATSDQFGLALAGGDVDRDGWRDLSIGGPGYNPGAAAATGRVYIMYNDGSIPTTAATANVTITGNAASDNFGAAIVTGDFNTDSRVDLAVGAYGYSTSTGRTYIFNNDGSIPTTAATADVTITGETTNNSFGSSLVSGDMNFDGKTDLIVGAIGYTTNTGRAYIFYNDGSIPTTAATADETITGQSTNVYFGSSLVVTDLNRDGRDDLLVGSYGYGSSNGRVYLYTLNDSTLNVSSSLFGWNMLTGDFNTDGTNDLVVSGVGYNSSAGRVYIFYGSNALSPTAATPDVTITGNGGANSFFGDTLASADLNTDGKIDLVVGEYGYTAGGGTGRAFIFYNDGSYPADDTSADVIITGETTNNFFGQSLATGDVNADGKTDLVVGARGYSSNTGRAYIFYNDGSIPTTAATADVIITGAGTNNYFGVSLVTGDFNSDGEIDLLIGANGAASGFGVAYLFYNDGSIPTTAGTADLTITGGAAGGALGQKVNAGDINFDGRTDLIIAAPGDSSSERVYLFYNDGSIPTTSGTADIAIDGEASSGFGNALASGDLNADGRADVVVGAYLYSSTTGRAYVFYNDGSIPTTAATADVVVTGPVASSNFGANLTVGDLNEDGFTDLIVGAWDIVNKAYVFITETNQSSATQDRALEIRGNTQWRGAGQVR